MSPATPTLHRSPCIRPTADVEPMSQLSLAWAPASPDSVTIRGAVQPSTSLRWKAVAAPDLAGYRIYWRRPSEVNWTRSRFVGNVTEFTLENVIIDDFFFGVAAVDREGHESLVSFPR